MSNPFFKNTGPHDINHLLTLINLTNQKFPNEKISDIKDLSTSQNGEISFFHSKKYNELAKITKASYCLTTENLKSILPITCKPIITNKVLLNTAQITKIFYPDSLTDNFDNTAEDIIKTEHKDKVKFGNNVLIGKNVKIGSNCLIGHNSIIVLDPITVFLPILTFFPIKTLLPNFTPGNLDLFGFFNDMSG